MNKIWKIILSIKPYYIFIFLLVFSTISIFSLRSNNQNMGKLREKVYAADQSGVGVEPALNNLRFYVNSHMNTALSSGSTSVYPPIQLQYTYQRLVSAQSESNNSTVYNDAQTYCQQQNPTGFSGRTRVDCVQQYVQSHGVTNTPIPTGLYEFDFQSPTWSPDLAGWMLVVSAFTLCIFVIDIFYWISKKRKTKNINH